MVAELRTGRAQSDDFRMPAGIGLPDRLVAPAADDLTVKHDDSSHRNLALPRRSFGFCERSTHRIEVCLWPGRSH
jgi:hypothetical protein